MKVLFAYLNLYGECLSKALLGVRKNLWTLLLPMGLLVALWVVSPLVLALGFVGGFVLALAMDALGSCYLYFTGEVVGQSRVSLKEFKTSIGAYFWSIMNLLFVLWIVNFLLGMLGRGSQADLLRGAVSLLMLVLLNPAPEVIYIRGTRNGMETIQRSIKFIQENWIEWFLPNAVVLGGGYLLLQQALPYLGGGLLVGLAILGAFLHLFMVFRGHLFQALDSSSHRQRMYRYRTAA